jgi:MFS family permease
MLPDAMSWQGPFIVQILLSFLLVVMSFFLPETPRWLAKNGFMKESLQTVADLHSNGDTSAEHVQQVFLEIQEAVVYEANLGKSSWKVGVTTALCVPYPHTNHYQEMFTRYRKRTIVGITVQMFAQLNGINIISFYLPSTLASAGFDDKKSLLYTAANALPYTAATIATWWLADRWGRKPLLLLGGVMMAILLGIVCAFTQASRQGRTGNTLLSCSITSCMVLHGVRCRGFCPLRSFHYVDDQRAWRSLQRKCSLMQ